MSNTVGSDYFRTLRINLLAGREFEDRDDETAAPVAVVNNTLAQRFWGGAANAIGKRIRVGRRRLAHGDRRRRGREVPADQRSAAAVRLRAVPAVVPVEHDPAHAGRGADRSPRRAGARAVAALDADLPILNAGTAGRRDARGADPLRASWRRCCSSSARPAWRSPRWAPTGWCRTPSSRARTKSAFAWRSARRRWSVVRGFLARGLRLGAIGAAIGVVAALGVTQAARQRAVRRQRDRRHLLRACAGDRPGRRGRRDPRSGVAGVTDESAEGAAASVNGRYRVGSSSRCVVRQSSKFWGRRGGVCCARIGGGVMWRRILLLSSGFRAFRIVFQPAHVFLRSLHENEDDFRSARRCPQSQQDDDPIDSRYVAAVFASAL